MSKYNNWQDDLSASVKAFEGIRKTYLPRVISGKIHTIEQAKNEVLIMLDTTSGIDYIRQDEHGLQGIAARAQWGNAWDTFTIREARHTGTQTELEKRLYQIHNGYFFPFFTMQAYFDNKEDNNLLSIAVIKTADLYWLYENKACIFHRRASDNEFLFVNWYAIRKYIRSINTQKSKGQN